MTKRKNKSRTDQDLCVVDGRYRRTIGKFVNATGKVAPKKFLLGTDRRAAELANARLEMLWRDVCTQNEKDNADNAWAYKQWLASGMAIPGEGVPQSMAQREPLWTDEALRLAEAIRTGQNYMEVEWPPYGIEDKHYVQHIESLRSKYPSVAFVPADVSAYSRGQSVYKTIASRHAQEAAKAAAIAECPIPAGTGQTLYQAIDAFAVWVRENKKKEGETTSWGNVLAETVRRLKEGHSDIPLDRFDYNAIERVKAYWAGRPKAKVSGKPIALDTVRSHLTALKMFVKWLHRNPDFTWRKPEDVENAWAVDLRLLMTNDELASLGDGVATFTVEELTTLYRYATDRDRILMLLGLNCGFARAECASLRLDEIKRDGHGTYIRRIRRKTHVPGQWTLWPDTVRALEWMASERALAEPSGNKFVILSERGAEFSPHRVANQWNKLLDRIQKDHPDFRRLPFKFLRKTAGQLVRDASDGETMGVFLCHGQPVRTDELSDVYSNRNFGRVAETLGRIHAQLQPLFDASPEAFAQPRKRGGSRITRGTVEKIHRLGAEGRSPEGIAAACDVSRSTIYRYLPQRTAKPTCGA